MSTDPKKKPDTDPAVEPTATKPEPQEPPAPPTPQPQPQSEISEPDDDSEPERNPEPDSEPNDDSVPDSVDEVTALRHELQAANAKLAAYKSGVPSAGQCAEKRDDSPVPHHREGHYRSAGGKGTGGFLPPEGH